MSVAAPATKTMHLLGQPLKEPQALTLYLTRDATQSPGPWSSLVTMLNERRIKPAGFTDETRWQAAVFQHVVSSRSADDVSAVNPFDFSHVVTQASEKKEMEAAKQKAAGAAPTLRCDSQSDMLVRFALRPFEQPSDMALTLQLELTAEDVRELNEDTIGRAAFFRSPENDALFLIGQPLPVTSFLKRVIVGDRMWQDAIVQGVRVAGPSQVQWLRASEARKILQPDISVEKEAVVAATAKLDEKPVEKLIDIPVEKEDAADTKPVEKLIDIPAEKEAAAAATAKPIEKPVDIPVEKEAAAAAKPVEVMADIPAEKEAVAAATAKPIEKPIDIPVEKEAAAAAKPVEVMADIPAEKEAVAAAKLDEKPVDIPVEKEDAADTKPVEEMADIPAEKEAVAAAAKPIEKPIDIPVEKEAAAKPVEVMADIPVEKEAAEAAANPVEKLIDIPVEKEAVAAATAKPIDIPVEKEAAAAAKPAEKPADIPAEKEADAAAAKPVEEMADIPLEPSCGPTEEVSGCKESDEVRFDTVHPVDAEMRDVDDSIKVKVQHVSPDVPFGAAVTATAVAAVEDAANAAAAAAKVKDEVASGSGDKALVGQVLDFMADAVAEVTPLLSSPASEENKAEEVSAPAPGPEDSTAACKKRSSENEEEDERDSKRARTDSTSPFELVNDLGREYDDTRPLIRSIKFKITRDGVVQETTIFSEPVTEKVALANVQTYLSQPLTREYFDRVKVSISGKTWEEACAEYKTRAHCMAEACVVTGVELSEAGEMEVLIAH